MIDLLPAERWEYGFKDVVDGMAAILGGTTSPESLYIPGLGESVPTRSARAGIVAAIGALRIRRGATIGVPLYCCPVVFKAVVAAGCKVRFIDVETSSYCLSADDLSAKIDQMDAVIAVHMFGNPCDMDKIKKAAAGRPIIEDCAQALGSMLGGRHVGSLGEISVFSFRSGKYLSVGEGGALYSEDCSIHSRLAEIVNSTAVPPPLEQYLHVAKTYMRTLLRRKPFYGLLGHALWQSYNKHAEYSTKSPLVVSRIFCADLAISAKKLPLLDSVIARQRANSDFFLRNLALPSDMLCVEQKGSFYNRYLFPLLFSTTAQRDFIAAYLFHHNIGTAKPYEKIGEIARTHYGYKGDCPLSESIAGRVLVVPHYCGVTVAEAEHVAKVTNDGWLKCQGE